VACGDRSAEQKTAVARDGWQLREARACPEVELPFLVARGRRFLLRWLGSLTATEKFKLALPNARATALTRWSGYRGLFAF
jgi:hypothetical protein